MSENKKRYYIKAEVTKEERDKIRQEADKQKTTITTLILNSLENNITVNLDTSDYRDLVIQFRRIGNNINGILKRIHYSNFITDTDIASVENSQRSLKKALNEERLKIKHTKRDLENLTPRKLRNYLKEENKRIPNYLIYDDITYQINRKLRDFIEIMEDEKANPIYTSYIDNFIRSFHPTNYSYDELVSFSDDLGEIIYRIDHKTITKNGKLTEEDIINVRNVLRKYRKEVDE